MSPLFLVLLLPTALLANPTCPHPCLCGNNVIVCSCGQASSPVTLEPFTSIDYIDKVYIHSCDSLTIPKDTFKGLAIGQEINIFSIKNLTIQAGAFRLMTKCPEQMTIRDSTLSPGIPAEAFSGLHDVKHLWFRGVDAGRIARNAFRDVYRIEYLYFRESNIKHIESNAFVGLIDVTKLFIRGSVHIGHIEEGAFRNSKVDTLMLEDARIESMHPHALAGLRSVRSVLIDNCTINQSQDHGTISRDVTRSIGSVKIERSRFAALALSAFSNAAEIVVFSSIVNQVLPGHVPVRNVSWISFQKVKIKTLGEGALKGLSDVGNIEFDECTIGSVERQAFGAMRGIGKFEFRNGKISQISAGAFDNSSFEIVIFEESIINEIEQNAFDRIRASLVSVVKNQIDSIQTDSFHALRADTLDIRENFIATMRLLALRDGRVRLVKVVQNQFRLIDRAAFSGLANIRLVLRENLYTCECDRSLAELQLMQSAESGLSRRAFLVEGNKCLPADNSSRPIELDQFVQSCPSGSLTAATLGLRLSDKSPLHCTQLTLVVDCFCEPSSSHVRLTAALLRDMPRTVNRLTFRSCKSLSIDSGTFKGRSILSLRFSDIRSLDLSPDAFAGIPPLYQLEFERVSIRVLPSESLSIDQPLGLLSFLSSKIDFVESSIATRGQIDEVIIADSDVGTLSAYVFDRIQVQNVTLQRNSLTTLGAHLFQADSIGAYLLLESNRIRYLHEKAIDPRLLSRPTTIITHNDVACDCSREFLRTLKGIERSRLDSNLCSGPDSMFNRTVYQAMLNMDALLTFADSSNCPPPLSETKPYKKPNKPTRRPGDRMYQTTSSDTASQRQANAFDSSVASLLPSVLLVITTLLVQ